MTDKKQKFYVGNQFRKNDLSKKESNIVAEVHIPGDITKLYTNVHFPNAFASRVFEQNSTADRVTFKDSSSSNKEWTIYRHQS
jgi:hypothetical protein